MSNYLNTTLNELKIDLHDMIIKILEINPFTERDLVLGENLGNSRKT